MAYKPLWNWMDKNEGRKEGSSHEAMEKERKYQQHHASVMNVKGVVPSMTGQKYKVHAPTKKEMAKKMESKSYTHSRCGKCNRFGHTHDKCATGKKDSTFEKIKQNTARQVYKAGYGHYEHDEM